MNRKPPSLQLHATGQWFTHWGGAHHYFGKEKAQAEKLYLASIQQWAEWRKGRDQLRLPPIGRAELVVDLSERFFNFKEADGGLDLRRYYERSTRRFINFFGAARADMIRAHHLQAVKESMLKSGYAPKTINHDIIAIKSMLNWAMGLEAIPAVNLRGVRTVALGPVVDKSLPLKKVLKMFEKATTHNKADPSLAPWLKVNYLALARPIEVVRLVHKQGEWVGDGIFRFNRGKTDRTARLPRHLVLTDLALSWLAKCEPLWSRVDSYYHACERVFDCGVAHRMRHSAATHLHELGASRADVDLLLGHAPPRVSLTYIRVDWQSLRRTADLLKI
jgi:integrase